MTLAARVFDGITDAELVLLALALNSGATVAGTPDMAGRAEAINARLFELTGDEMRRREVDANVVAAGVMGRVVRCITEEAPEFRAPGG